MESPLNVLQLVPLERSALKGATMNIPSKPFDLDPDWEVDPESLEVGAKIGAPKATSKPCCDVCSIKKPKKKQAGDPPHVLAQHTTPTWTVICMLCTDKTLCPAALTAAGQEDRACR
jgi:hypothetical protein